MILPLTLTPYTMKAIRMYKTSGDYFIAEVVFIPTDEQGEALEDLLFPPLPGRECHLQLRFLLRYPEKAHVTFTTRLSVISHPNLSPLLVIGETNHFLSIITKMTEQ